MAILEYLSASIVGQVVDSASTLLGPVVQSRAERRTIEAQEAADAASLRRRLHEMAEAQRAKDADLERTLRELHERSRAARYPLSQPGSLRSLLDKGMVPHLLVSPVNLGEGSDPLAVARRVHDLITEVDGSGQMLRVLIGGFAYTNGKPREIDGNVGAMEVARTEFSPHPAIVVYFNQTDGPLAAHAVVSDLFATASGDCTFETPVARLSDQKIQYAVWRDPSFSGPHLEWIAAEEAVTNDEESLGTAITLFALSISSVYWLLQGVRWAIKSPDLQPLKGVIELSAASGAEGVTAQPPTERLEQELAALAAQRYEVDVADDPEGDGVIIRVRIPPRSVAFFLGQDFPTAPPAIYVREASGDIRPVALSEQYWEPSHSLAELIEALS